MSTPDTSDPTWMIPYASWADIHQDWLQVMIWCACMLVTLGLGVVSCGAVMMALGDALRRRNMRRATKEDGVDFSRAIAKHVSFSDYTPRVLAVSFMAGFGLALFTPLAFLLLGLAVLMGVLIGGMYLIITGFGAITNPKKTCDEFGKSCSCWMCYNDSITKAFRGHFSMSPVASQAKKHADAMGISYNCVSLGKTFCAVGAVMFTFFLGVTTYASIFVGMFVWSGDECSWAFSSAPTGHKCDSEYSFGHYFFYIAGFLGGISLVMNIGLCGFFGTLGYFCSKWQIDAMHVLTNYKGLKKDDSDSDDDKDKIRIGDIPLPSASSLSFMGGTGSSTVAVGSGDLSADFRGIQPMPVAIPVPSSASSLAHKERVVALEVKLLQDELDESRVEIERLKRELASEKVKRLEAELGLAKALADVAGDPMMGGMGVAPIIPMQDMHGPKPGPDAPPPDLY